MLIVHFIGLAMGLGTSIGFMILGMASAKMEKAEGQKFMLNAFSLSKMGHIGLVLLFLSGGYLMTPYWSTLEHSPTLIAKLVLFVVLGGLIGMISSKAKKAKKGDAEKHMASIRPLGTVSLLVALTIVTLAVLTFH